jgi:hypothetical protein
MLSDIPRFPHPLNLTPRPRRFRCNKIRSQPPLFEPIHVLPVLSAAWPHAAFKAEQYLISLARPSFVRTAARRALLPSKIKAQSDDGFTLDRTLSTLELRDSRSKPWSATKD